MKAYMFPGQGIQRKGMGNGLFDEFQELTEMADRILGYSIKELCLEDPRGCLVQTQFTQPAIFVVNALSYLKIINQSGEKPDYVLGHSLGELNALMAAECFDFETGLRIVKKRGELMGHAKGGGMAAIQNAGPEEITSILKDNGLSGIDLANFNTPLQTVISGPKDDIAKAESFFKKGKMQFIPLNTSGAFHSRYMKPAKKSFKTFMQEFKSLKPRIPVISNVTAELHAEGKICENILNQIDSPVRWCESVKNLMNRGVTDFIEVGNGGILTKMVQKIREQSRETVADKKPEEVKNEKGDKTACVKVTEIERDQNGKTNDNHCGEPRNMTADEKVAAWNKKYPVGTKVKSIIVKDGVLETRTNAVVLFGHRAAVYIKNYNGYFDLDEITAA